MLLANRINTSQNKHISISNIKLLPLHRKLFIAPWVICVELYQVKTYFAFEFVEKDIEDVVLFIISYISNAVAFKEEIEIKFFISLLVVPESIIF